MTNISITDNGDYRGPHRRVPGFNVCISWSVIVYVVVQHHVLVVLTFLLYMGLWYGLWYMNRKFCTDLVWFSWTWKWTWVWLPKICSLLMLAQLLPFISSTNIKIRDFTMVLVAAGLAEMNFLPKSYRVLMGLNSSCTTNWIYQCIQRRFIFDR